MIPTIIYLIGAFLTLVIAPRQLKIAMEASQRGEWQLSDTVAALYLSFAFALFWPLAAVFYPIVKLAHRYLKRAFPAL